MEGIIAEYRLGSPLVIPFNIVCGYCNHKQQNQHIGGGGEKMKTPPLPPDEDDGESMVYSPVIHKHHGGGIGIRNK